MRIQGIALWRWLCRHRREMATGTAVAFVVTLLVVLGPMLLGIAAVERMHDRRRKRLVGLMLASLFMRALAWLWRDLFGMPHGRWHACLQCGMPIVAPSRACYCSTACRRYARLERYAAGGDEQERERLALPFSSSDVDPALADIPF
jgi:hypothetical protein